MGEEVCGVTCRAGRLDSRLVVCTVAVRGQQAADNLGETDKLDMYTGTAKQGFVAVAKIAAGDSSPLAGANEEQGLCSPFQIISN